MSSESRLDPKVRAARALMNANPYNVLFGSGYHLNSLRHKSPYRALIKDHCVYYNQETPRLKYSFIEARILQVIRDNGGKFYRWCDDNNTWVEEGKRNVLHTVAQALRSEFKLVQRFKHPTMHDSHYDGDETETQDEDEEKQEDDGDTVVEDQGLSNAIESPSAELLALPHPISKDSIGEDRKASAQSRIEFPSVLEYNTAHAAAKAMQEETGATVMYPHFQNIAVEGAGDDGYKNEEDAHRDISLTSNLLAALGSTEDRIRVIKYVLNKDAEKSKPLKLPRTVLDNAMHFVDAGLSILERELGLESSTDDPATVSPNKKGE